MQHLVLMSVSRSPSLVPRDEQGSVTCVSMCTSEAIHFPGTGCAHWAFGFPSLASLDSSGPRDSRHRGGVFLPWDTEGLWSCQLVTAFPLTFELSEGDPGGAPARLQQALERNGFGFGWDF